MKRGLYLFWAILWCSTLWAQSWPQRTVKFILPLGPEKTLTIFEWFAYSDAGVQQATIDFSDEIQQEDIRICESVQRGLRSRNYDRGRFSVKRENGVHHFHGLMAEFLG